VIFQKKGEWVRFGKAQVGEVDKQPRMSDTKVHVNYTIYSTVTSWPDYGGIYGAVPLPGRAFKARRCLLKGHHQNGIFVHLNAVGATATPQES